LISIIKQLAGFPAFQAENDDLGCIARGLIIVLQIAGFPAFQAENDVLGFIARIGRPAEN